MKTKQCGIEYPSESGKSHKILYTSETRILILAKRKARKDHMMC